MAASITASATAAWDRRAVAGKGVTSFYNTYVSHVNIIIQNTYNTRVTNITENHVSYNGGTGGVEARPTSQEQSYANER